MEKARLSVEGQRKLYLARKLLMYEQRVAKFKSDQEEKRRKAIALATEKESLVKQIEEHGGLWDAGNIEAHLAKINSPKAKCLAFKIQLNFRKIVLGSACKRSLFFMSSAGRNRTLDELKTNFLTVINHSNPTMEITSDIDDTSIPEPIFSVIPSDVLNGERKSLFGEAKACANKLSGKQLSKEAKSKVKDLRLV